MEADDRFIPCPACEGRGSIEVTPQEKAWIEVLEASQAHRIAEDAALGHEWATNDTLENGS